MKITQKEQIENALLSGTTMQELFESGFNPGSIGFVMSRLSSQGKIKRPAGFVGWIQRAQRKWIFKRDNYTCQKCGARGKSVKLQLHHKDHNKKNNRSTNRVTWCSKCNFDEGQEWAEELRAKIKDRKVMALPTRSVVTCDYTGMANDVTSFMSNLLDDIKKVRES